MLIIIRKILILFIFSLSVKVYSAEEGAEALVAASPVSTSNMIIQVLIALAIVTAAIFALAWVVKRLGNTHLLQQRNLKVLSTMPLGTREKVILIEVENQKILLGVTPSNISSLHVFSASEESSSTDTEEDKTESQTNGIQTNNTQLNEKWDFTRYFKKVVGDAQRRGTADNDLGNSPEPAGINSPEPAGISSPEPVRINSSESELEKISENNPEGSRG